MTANCIMQSVGSIFKGFWKRHQENLGLLVAAVAETGRVGVSALGRALEGKTTPKHAIKRVDKFLGNPRFRDHAAMETLLKAVLGPRREVLIAVDWTKIRQWPALVAGVIQRGRAIPVMWAVMDPLNVYKSYNHFENGFFTWLSQALPEGVDAVVLLDRGFKRVELVKHLNKCGLKFVIRTGGNVYVNHEQYQGRVDMLITRRGMRRDLRDATLRPSRPVTVRVVGMWARGQKEPWLLMTNLSIASKLVIAAYGKRFRIEEMFRDEKDYRFGIFLGYVKVTKPERLERLLLIAAVYHLMAMMIGGLARRQGLDRSFRANTVRNKATHSDFTLGRYYLHRLTWILAKLFKDFYAESGCAYGG